MKKIAIIIPDSNGSYPVPATKGGAVSQLVEHLVKDNSEQNKASFFIFTFFDEIAYEKSKKYNNVTFEWIKVPRIIKSFDKVLFKIMTIFFKKKKLISYRTIFSLIYMMFKVHIKLKKSNYDIVVVENNVVFFNAFRGIWNKYKDIVYLHLHNIPRISGGSKKMIQSLNCILCVSEFVATKLINGDTPLGAIEKEKVRVLYNCVDTELFKPIEKRQSVLRKWRNKFEISEDDNVIVFVGRLSKEKGVDLLLRFLENLSDGEKTTLLIVGSLIYSSNIKDEYINEIKKLEKKINNSRKKRVIFTGYISNEALVYIYNIADIAILPSIWEEPAGLTMIESMACGTPVITIDTGGIKEYVSNAGIVIKKDNRIVENLTRTYKKIVNKKCSNDYKENIARERVIKEFDSRKYLDYFLDKL